MEYDYVWHWKSRLPGRKGQACRVLLRVARTNSVVVEFRDGLRVNTSKWAVRPVVEAKPKALKGFQL